MQSVCRTQLPRQQLWPSHRRRSAPMSSLGMVVVSKLRPVSSLKVSAIQGLYTYGVEFLQQDSVKDFWGIIFPSQA
jgi:hypothetical protein